MMLGLVLYPAPAALIALGIKTAETRPGPPAGDMRPDGVKQRVGGRKINRWDDVVIVAGRTLPPVGERPFGPFTTERTRGVKDVLLRGEQLAWPYRIPSGHALCVVKFAGAWRVEDRHDGQVRFADVERWTIDERTGGLVLPHAELYLGDYRPGRWVLPITKVRRVGPIKVKGGQGAYDLPEREGDRIQAESIGITARSVWEHMRTDSDLDALGNRLPEWAWPWLGDVIADLSGSFALGMQELEALVEPGVPVPETHPHHQAATALAAGDRLRAEAHVWGSLRPGVEWPRRVSAEAPRSR